MTSPLMDCSQFFPSSSPSRSTRPVADARSSSPSSKTDPASEDGQSHNTLNNSFQDSGYGDSIEGSEHNHGIKVATPSSVSIDGRADFCTRSTSSATGLKTSSFLGSLAQPAESPQTGSFTCPEERGPTFNSTLIASEVVLMLTEVVWQGASQMRNDLKKKAKLVADEAYGLMGMKAQQKRALATWLTTSCRETLKDGVVMNVPNFIFPVVEVVWVDGQRGNKSSYVDSVEASTEMSERKLNTRMPFQHPAISKLIYAFWFSGQTQAEVNAQREKFSVVPDNLIALVCNALEAALKDHLQASTGNVLDLQCSNKIYAPKWDDLMTLLEGIQSLSPAGYQSMKTVISGRINAKLKEDEKVHGLEEESSPGRPTNRIPFHDLATNEVDVDNLNLDGGELVRHKTRADRDKAEADVAGTQQAGAGTLVDFTPIPPAGGDITHSSEARVDKQASACTGPSCDIYSRGRQHIRGSCLKGWIGRRERRLTDKDQLPPQQRGRGLKRNTASSKHLFNLGEGWYNGLVHVFSPVVVCF
ncbi:hypothetical protein C8Q72DRAFT_796273 [Fomitopsis betulina]|nr:hypothetical protein C8Q72DRAFT_796273 [Fomitopsis betulina]